MELKRRYVSLQPTGLMSINRTFMELKLNPKTGGQTAVPRYQSNLYGIETRGSDIHPYRGFLYQSNLYGIETLLNPPSSWIWWCINRTFMELKPRIRKAQTPSKPVSIEPLWNWNHLHARRQQEGSHVSIEPLWNWNIIFLLLLKNLISINRTFMELKQLSIKSNTATNFVSIEPLWNWNVRGVLLQVRATGINRTFMELKLLSPFL